LHRKKSQDFRNKVPTSLKILPKEKQEVGPMLSKRRTKETLALPIIIANGLDDHHQSNNINRGLLENLSMIWKIPCPHDGEH
jgi:hypothetical protein